MFRNLLPRIYELRDSLGTPLPAGAYFQNLDETLSGWPLKRKQYRDLEAVLQVLDDDAWMSLKAAVKSELKNKLPLRGWQQAFNTLNEAKGYAYLSSIGCTGIRFIPRSKADGQRTPDLEASKLGRRVLCEVKTINNSHDEAERSANDAVSSTLDQLSHGFFDKLERVLNEALAQMRAYCSEAGTRRIAYVVINYDDPLHEYADRYQEQLESFLASRKPPDLEVEWDIRPPFYIAQA